MSFHGNSSSLRHDIIILVTRVGQKNIPGVKRALWLTQRISRLV